MLPLSVPDILWAVLLKIPQSTLPSSWTLRELHTGETSSSHFAPENCATVLMTTENNKFSSSVPRENLEWKGLALPYYCPTCLPCLALPCPFFPLLKTQICHHALTKAILHLLALLLLPTSFSHYLLPPGMLLFSVCQGTLWSCVFLVFPCKFPPRKFPFP